MSVIRIGTRDSELAMWQALTVEKQLNNLGYKTELVAVKSTGDLILDKPLHELGITGAFTKTLDIAMIKGEIDIAVHSLKDVPTKLPNDMILAAVLQRGPHQDILVYKENYQQENKQTIATGSLRRKAFWLNRFENHQVVGLRGNVNSRLQKLENNDWNAAIFALAGLKRINLTDKMPFDFQTLDWMTPSPSQGIVGITVMEDKQFVVDACAKLNHQETMISATVERQFLRTTEGGCTAPIGAYTWVQGDKLNIKATLLTPDGTQRVDLESQTSVDNYKNIGEQWAKECLAKGGDKIMKAIQDFQS